MDVVLISRAIFSRMIFFVHGMVAIYLYKQEKSNPYYWCLVIPLLFLLIESSIAVICRKGKEYNYFWPSGFLYITCIIQIIWLNELDLFESKIQNEELKKSRANYTNLSPLEQQKIESEIFLNAFDTTRNSTLKKTCEIGLILGVLIARWVMSRGSMSKQQLSALLLLQVGNAADILELFAVFEEPEVINNKDVTIAVTCVFTWSMYQFTLFSTATTREPGKWEEHKENTKVMTTARDFHKNSVLKRTYINNVRTTTSSPLHGKRREHGKRKIEIAPRGNSRYVNNNPNQQYRKVITRRKLHGELFQILVTLLMQDGPYLIVRLFLMVQFHISSEMHIFFTCKNALVSILLVYRIMILSCRGEDEESTWHREDADAKLHNVQVALDAVKTSDLDMEYVLVK